MEVCPQNNWESYNFRAESGPAFVSFFAEAKDIPQADFPHCARVLIRIKNPGPSGGPTKEEAEILWAMEDAIVADLEKNSVKCVLLARITYNGRRELVFQLHDWETFRPPFGDWMKAHSGYETDISEHEGWTFFSESIWPSREDWQCIFDRRVVDNLKKAGSNPAREHTLEFVFRGEIEPLNEIMRALLMRSYWVVKLSPEEQMLIIAKNLPLDLSLITRESLSHLKEADRLKIEYDGWGCLVVK